MIHSILVLIGIWVLVTVAILAYDATEDPTYNFDEPTEAEDEPNT